MSLKLYRNFKLEFNDSLNWSKKKAKVQNALPSWLNLKVLEISKNVALVLDKETEEIDYYSLSTMECLSDQDKTPLPIFFELFPLSRSVSVSINQVMNYIQSCFKNLKSRETFLVLYQGSRKEGVLEKIGYFDSASKICYTQTNVLGKIYVNYLICPQPNSNKFSRKSGVILCSADVVNQSTDDEFFLRIPDEEDLINYNSYQYAANT